MRIRWDLTSFLFHLFLPVFSSITLLETLSCHAVGAQITSQATILAILIIEHISFIPASDSPSP